MGSATSQAALRALARARHPRRRGIGSPAYATYVKPILVRPAAAADIEDTFFWYKTQRTMLGPRFQTR